MATFKSEFQDLAAELINDEFLDFQQPFVIKKDIGYDPITDTETKLSIDTGAIPIDLRTAEQVFSNVTAADIYLVIINTAPVPSDFDASYYCSYDGVEYEINEVKGDPAGAAYFVRIVI